MTDEATPTRRLARAATFVFGPRSARRLSIVQGLDDAAGSLVNISLLGTLFVNVSFTASRDRVLSYLLMTTAPLIVAAPLMGRLLDRTSSGFRLGIIGTQLLRAGLVVAMSMSVYSTALYPLVFAVLLCRRAFGLAKTALMTSIITDRDELVQSSGAIGRAGAIVGGTGTAIGGALFAVADAPMVLLASSVVFLTAAAVSFRLPSPVRPRRMLVLAGAGGGIPAGMWLTVSGVSVLRAVGGAMTYLLAFAIKAGGGQKWVFGAALGAAGVGNFLGTWLATPLLRRVQPSKLVVWLLAIPALIAGVGVLSISNLPVIVIALAIGLANSLSTRTVDVLVSEVPSLARGGVVARTELQFNVAALLGAVVAVWFTPAPRSGFAVVVVVLALGAMFYASKVGVRLRTEFVRLVVGEQAPDLDAVLPASLLRESERYAALGAYRLAVLTAGNAVEVLRQRGAIDLDDEHLATWDSTHRPLIDDVRAHDRHPSSDEVEELQDAATALWRLARTSDPVPSDSADRPSP